MTSNDVPSPGAGAGRRRALGRGPGAAPATGAPAAVEPVGGESAGGEPAVTEPSSEASALTEPPVVTEPPAAVPTAVEPVVVEPAPEPSPGLEPEPEPAPKPGQEPGPEPEPASWPEPEPKPASKPEPESEPSSWPEPEPGSESGPERAAEVVSGAPRASAEPAVAAQAAEAQEPGDGVFKVRLSNFEGPFDLLLQLISKHKLDVTEVALSKVTDEFMAHIRAMGPDWDLDQTTEFLVVAATLLDLKAARLLPSAEVEDEGDLALLEARDLLFARLLQYRAYKQIADIFSARLDDEARRYPRTVGLEPQHAELLPEVVISIGAEGFARLAVKAMQPRPKPQVYVDHIHAPLVSVQEQAGIVVARLRELGEASFRTLVEDTDDTLTVVARFLALLELYREKAVALEQEAALGELLVRWTGGEGEDRPMVTDEFDRPPEPAKEDKA
ncbi:segregation/condensation protein A [Streptomyces panaciradicis]|nr:segregation/condensation protein A [Streptomyces panaciradicis]MCL6673487.1 segregation/condensation protein A [Streptomyces panaciradicis]